MCIDHIYNVYSKYKVSERVAVSLNFYYFSIEDKKTKSDCYVWKCLISGDSSRLIRR